MKFIKKFRIQYQRPYADISVELRLRKNRKGVLFMLKQDVNQKDHNKSIKMGSESF